ncbi:DUF262 domain-containing protein [Pseudomonas frederiksbergensis]
MLPAPLLKGTVRAYTIEQLIPSASMVRDLAQQADSRQIMRFTLPTWQRPETWELKQKVRFIEGIFLNFGCGYLVVNAREWMNTADAPPAPMAGWLIDGQQRVAAIRDFLAGLFPVFGNVYWNMLDRPTQIRRFLGVSFPHFELEYVADEQLLKEIYDRLNFGGTPHTEADRLLLNAVVSRGLGA